MRTDGEVEVLGLADAAGHLVRDMEWPALVQRMRDVVPQAFGSRGEVLNLIAGEWSHPGHGKTFLSSCDGTLLGSFPMIDLATAREAVRYAATEHRDWSRIDLDERRRRVGVCAEGLRTHRETLAALLMWEIGKPYRQALTSVDRCISGVEWYVEHIERMMEDRTPLGLVSNIASWNYPLSVLVHAVLVQTLAGNAVIAKTPSDGGLYALTLSLALARECGLPVSLVSGSGGQLGDALVRGDGVACLAFVGGRTNGRDIAASLYDQSKRYMLEMEGINAYGIWDFSDWATLAAQLKKGFEYGKQRCTAYARFVVQRHLFPRFLETYLATVSVIEVGHPVKQGRHSAEPPVLDFGPLINAKAVEELRVMYSEAIGKGAVSVYEGELDESLFLRAQDISAYIAPAALMNVPRNCALYHKEPFGPIDTFVVVDTVEELIAEMNVSNGNLVASIGCDDQTVAQRIAGELRAFKVGINALRSRGDGEEPFGGIGESWKGCFVGGEYLVQAVTEGPAWQRLHGNFPDYTLLPASR